MLISKLFRPSPYDTGILYLFKDVAARFRRHRLSQVGGQLAYFLLLSLFPFLIFLNALVGMLHISTDALWSYLSPLLPQQITALIAEYNNYAVQTQSTGLLSVGLIVTLYSASRAVRSLNYAINHAYGIARQRGFLKDLVLSLSFTLCVGLLLLITAVFLTAGSGIVKYLAPKFGMSPSAFSTIRTISWILCAGVLFMIVCAIYWVMPNRKFRFVKVLPGAVFTLVGWFALTIGFSIYINHFSNYSVLYGSLGAVIILMLYLYLTGIILLLGAEINSSAEHMPRRKGTSARTPK